MCLSLADGAVMRSVPLCSEQQTQGPAFVLTFLGNGACNFLSVYLIVLVCFPRWFLTTVRRFGGDRQETGILCSMKVFLMVKSASLSHRLIFVCVSITGPLSQRHRQPNADDECHKDPFGALPSRDAMKRSSGRPSLKQHEPSDTAPGLTHAPSSQHLLL